MENLDVIKKDVENLCEVTISAYLSQRQFNKLEDYIYQERRKRGDRTFGISQAIREFIDTGLPINVEYKKTALKIEIEKTSFQLNSLLDELHKLTHYD